MSSEYCAAGYFATEGGLAACVPCPRGSYQPHPKGINCIQCPSGTNTVDDGSTSLSDCKVGELDVRQKSGNTKTFNYLK